jgi:hypothetical protein
MPTEADKLVLEIQAARRSMVRAAPDERAFYEQWIETNERRLTEMRTPTTSEPTIAPAQTIEPEPADEDDTVGELCGCGRPSSHKGRCEVRRAAAEVRKMGGGKTVKKQSAIAPRAVSAEAEPPAVMKPESSRGISVQPGANGSLQFNVIAIRDDNRVEVSGSSPALLLKAIEMIGGWE